MVSEEQENYRLGIVTEGVDICGDLLARVGNTCQIIVDSIVGPIAQTFVGNIFFPKELLRVVRRVILEGHAEGEIGIILGGFFLVDALQFGE